MNQYLVTVSGLLGDTIREAEDTVKKYRKDISYSTIMVRRGRSLDGKEFTVSAKKVTGELDVCVEMIWAYRKVGMSCGAFMLEDGSWGLMMDTELVPRPIGPSRTIGEVVYHYLTL